MGGDEVEVESWPLPYGATCDVAVRKVLSLTSACVSSAVVLHLLGCVQGLGAPPLEVSRSSSYGRDLVSTISIESAPPQPVSSLR